MGMQLLPWYAIRVRTGAEARLKTSLEQKGSEIFLPTWLDCRQYSDRIKKIQSPLFPGYLFCRLDVEKRLPILTTPGVESIVHIAGVPQPIEDSEIEAIQRAVNANLNAVPWPYLKSGDRVRVVFGSMSGVEGQLVTVKGKDRLVLSVEILQRSISFEIDRTWIRPVEINQNIILR